jgi:large subunit ribosomal protein L24
MAKFKIKKDDEVIVTTGKDKGKKGKVVEIITKEGRAIVSGINIATKHQKPSAMGPGGIVKKELPIAISNLAVVDPKSGKATKVGYKIVNGEKIRIAKKSGEKLN